MCLSKITRRKTTELTKVRSAFKSFLGHPSDYFIFTDRTLNDNEIVPRGEWIKAESCSLQASSQFNFAPYRSGFHCFSTLAGAENWVGGVKIKVLVKGVRTIGQQEGYAALVADYMYVPAPNEKIVGNKIVKVVR